MVETFPKTAMAREHFWQIRLKRMNNNGPKKMQLLWHRQQENHYFRFTIYDLRGLQESKKDL
jgi:hypothetical protein